MRTREREEMKEELGQAVFSNSGPQKITASLCPSTEQYEPPGRGWVLALSSASWATGQWGEQNAWAQTQVCLNLAETWGWGKVLLREKKEKFF